MPRWMTRMSSSSRPSRRYLPARRIEEILRPSSRSRNSGPLLWRRTERLPFTSTVFTRRPTTSFSRSRRMVSTSGSSGMAVHVATGVLTVQSGVLVGRVEGGEGGVGGGLLGVLLGAALSLAHDRSAHDHRGRVATSVVGARPRHFVDGKLSLPAHHHLLQTGLEVLGPGSGRRLLDAVVEQP